MIAHHLDSTPRTLKKNTRLFSGMLFLPFWFPRLLLFLYCHSAQKVSSFSHGLLNSLAKGHDFAYSWSPGIYQVPELWKGAVSKGGLSSTYLAVYYTGHQELPRLWFHVLNYIVSYIHQILPQICIDMILVVV